MLFHRLLMRLLCPAKPAMQIVKNLIFDPTCDVISDPQIKLCYIFEKFKSGAIKCSFRIENRSSSLADSTGGGGGETTHPSSAGRVREYPTGARAIIIMLIPVVPACSATPFLCVPRSEPSCNANRQLWIQLCLRGCDSDCVCMKNTNFWC